MTQRRPLLAVLLLLGLVSSAACGSAQDRPVVVETFPAEGAVLPGTITEIRFTFDDEVTIQNATQIAVNSAGDSWLPVSRVDPDDPRSILVRPRSGSYWRAGDNAVSIIPGFEVNSLGHYRLESFRLTFSLGTAQPVYFGVPAPPAVVQTEGLEFTPVGTVPTPGGRAPMGLTCSFVEADQRTWVQLEAGGGVGEALAWFSAGSAAMTTVSLTHEAGGDLVVDHPAVAVDDAGEYAYAAYRDTALGRIRLHRVAVATGLEVDALVLSPAASAGTTPQGLSLTPDGLYADVVCATDAGARLVAVDLDTFLEIDLGPDPGVDGLPLPAGGGQSVNGDTLTMIGPYAAANAVLTTADAVGLTVAELDSVVVGSPRTILLTPERRWVLQGLSGYADDEAFSYRRLTNLLDERATVIDDDTGQGNGAATSVHDVAWFTGSTRLVALLDNDAAVVLRSLSTGIEQEDLDETTPGAAIDLSGIAPGATLVAVPPPSRPAAP